jgi:uncharacterized protein YeeX (DUF496 family)
MKGLKEFRCSSEELPVIGDFVSLNVKRDLVDFTAFSPKFDSNYVLTFDAEIKTCSELVSSKEETAKSKVITTHMYSTMDSLTGLANNLSIYIKMAKADIPISIADFGIPALRKDVHRRNAEGVLKNLHILNNCILQYKDALTKQGLSDAVISAFAAAAVSIRDDNRKQYELVSNRKELVQNNMELFNGLYAKIIEICQVGKALYKGKDEKKVKDYTFSELMKQVRVVSKRNKEAEKEEDNTPENES